MTDSKRIVEPAGGSIHPLPWPYSHGVLAGGTLYLAGQVALDEELRLIGPGDFAEQARQTWRNIQTVVEAAGGTLADIVRVTAYMADMSHLETLHEVRREFLGDGGFPAATVVEVQALGLPGLMLEVEATAVIGSGS